MAAYNLHYTSAFRLHKPTLSSFSYRQPILCHAPRKMTTSQDQSSYRASITADIEAHLKQAIPLKSPLSVYAPMHHMTFSAPPNPAPALCVAACELVGGDRSKAMAAASALHLMHAASFTHEHLPLTDRPKPKPKPKPTVDHPFNPNIELLIPDAMVPFAYELSAVSDDPTQDTSGRVLRVIVELARVMGSQGIVDAQYREVLVSPLDGRELNDIEWVDDMCRRKEGRLHACAAACGAILGGANEEEVERLRKYGLYVGIMQGYTNRLGRRVKELERVVELRNLAMKELDHFKGRKVEEISSFIVGL
ncbi:Heterodimeric geranylgeranyl pyrophosphate synthase small subunit [Morus notabilis]|uniref:Heterodimeric geranylgeranyl pyrophosphate synthase small subunit n=1 Tax=Morus notabilis TaxID=981085 RepID=W9QJK0_9ROSA|nr:heterodimeric geranylgeranyl pyrophosphate synthase small subunit, chloroplastic [Morus notabilis]EXB38724.1 Heterodimeric geranylgeranyl pyrophosphate synthase small subunit [Morus notabilis]